MKFNAFQKVLLLLSLFGVLSCSITKAPKKANQWYKGNLHAHSYWSDGDDFPEMIMEWYKNHDYQFAVLSDHSTLQKGDRWIKINEVRSGETALQKYKARYGEDWVEEKKDDQGNHLVRLKTIDEYRPNFEKVESFLIIQSEEISDRFENKPIHINATNVQELIKEQGGSSVSDVMQNNIDAVNQQREETGIPMFPHINHPNFGWAITPEDMIELHGERFFEVYNGHPMVHNFGDETRPGMDELWDRVITAYILDGKPLIYGLATDDSHNYHDIQVGKSNYGRGWIRVNASDLSAESIIKAMEAGEFYSTNGVELERIVRSDSKLSVKVKAEKDVNYTIQFIGTKESNLNNPGVTFLEVEGDEGSYALNPDDLYVRVLVISDKRKVNPYMEGEVERAWVQPIRNQALNIESHQ